MPIKLLAHGKRRQAQPGQDAVDAVDTRVEVEAEEVVRATKARNVAREADRMTVATNLNAGFVATLNDAGPGRAPNDFTVHVHATDDARIDLWQLVAVGLVKAEPVDKKRCLAHF